MNPKITRSWPRALLAISTAFLVWLWMMAVHELGHMLGAWFTGGNVTRVVLHPLALSRTDVSPNPQAIIVAWAGPVIGIALPLLAWIVMQSWRIPGWFVARFFAGFCLIANGAYLAIGSLEGVGDAGDLMRHGSPRWVLIAFGAVTAPMGFFLWHRLGRWFGIGANTRPVSARVAAVVALLVAATIVIELAFAATPQAA